MAGKPIYINPVGLDINIFDAECIYYCKSGKIDNSKSGSIEFYYSKHLLDEKWNFIKNIYEENTLIGIDYIKCSAYVNIDFMPESYNGVIVIYYGSLLTDQNDIYKLETILIDKMNTDSATYTIIKHLILTDDPEKKNNIDYIFPENKFSDYGIGDAENSDCNSNCDISKYTSNENDETGILSDILTINDDNDILLNGIDSYIINSDGPTDEYEKLKYTEVDDEYEKLKCNEVFNEYDDNDDDDDDDGCIDGVDVAEYDYNTKHDDKKNDKNVDENEDKIKENNDNVEIPTVVILDKRLKHIINSISNPKSKQMNKSDNVDDDPLNEDGKKNLHDVKMATNNTCVCS